MKDKKEIEKLLQKNYESKASIKNKHIKFPRGINVFFDNNKVTIEMKSEVGKGIFSNMQKDDAAFEAWCLIIRYWINEFRNAEFTVTWEKPTDGDKNEPHYQRFLYRVEKFKQLFDWFTLDSYHNGILKQDSKIKQAKTLFLNRPGDIRSTPYKKITDKSFDELSENDIERMFASLEGPRERLAAASGAKQDTVSYQLPVGIFQDKVTKKPKGNLITPALKSAIDLWAIGENDEKTLLIYELKKIKGASKNSVGALSELLFYAMTMSDVQNGLIAYEEKKKITEQDITCIQKTKKIKAFLLLNNPHPLLSQNVFSVHNIKNISSVECLKYDRNLNITKLW